MSDGRPHWVLIVLKHAGFRNTVQHVLTGDPHFEIVAAVGSGEEALAISQQRELDLVLLEIRLPGMSGLKTATLIKAGRPQTIILLLSGDWSPAYERLARASGITARLAKQTFSLTNLYRALENSSSV